MVASDEPAVANAKAEEAEQGVAWVRAALVLFNSVVYLALIHPAGSPPLAWGVIVVANLYSVVVLVWRPGPHSAVTSATWTAGTDLLLIAFWLAATGEASSPFFLLWGVSVVAVAFRFGPRTTRVVTAGYIAVDAALLWLWGALAFEPAILVRLAYIGFTGALGGYMASSNLAARRRERETALAQEQAVRDRAELEAVMVSAPLIILRTDLEGNIRFVNQVPKGMSPDIWRDATLFDFLDEEDTGTVRGAIAEVRRTKEPVTYEVHGPGPDGQESWYRSRMGPVFQGAVVAGIVLVTMDVTQEKRHEAEARRAILQDAEIERMAQDEVFRTRLLNAVSHELNTPLTPLRLQLDVLERRLGRDVGVDLLKRNLERLTRLVQDLLSVARLERGVPLDLQSGPVDRAFEEVVASFEPLAHRQGVRLEAVADGVVVRADSLRLMQVLTNLVSNAIKFTPPQGAVRLGAREGDGEAAVWVEDDGLGLTPAQCEQVLRPFEQVHASLDPEQPGTGLGLYIVGAIMTAHQGRLDVHSEGPGQGARFTCTFPS